MADNRFVWLILTGHSKGGAIIQLLQLRQLKSI